MVTQLEIARRVGLDVSSVNKILNRTPGPKFKRETVSQVFKVARELRYNFDRPTKPLLQRRVEEAETYLRALVPEYILDESLVHKLGVTIDAVRRMKEFLYPKGVKRARSKRQLRKVPDLPGQEAGAVHQPPSNDEAEARRCGLV